MIKRQSPPDFKTEKYILSLSNDRPELTITGVKTGRPSKRITFYADGIKIIHAEITSLRKNISFEYQIKRINHLPTFGEIRVHTHETLFPGNYTLKLGFNSKNLPQNYQQLDFEAGNLRPFIPLVDKADAGDETKFEIG